MKISEFFIVMYIQASDFFRIFQILLSAYCVFMCYYIYITFVFTINLIHLYKEQLVWINYSLLRMTKQSEMHLEFCLKIKVTLVVEAQLMVKKDLELFDKTFDLLIIDIMMPNISGIEVCRKIREKSYVPILFLTAKSLETDKMEALSAGGDDYLVKPFSYVELIARIQALIRRCRVYDNADASDTTASSTIERCGLTLYTKCNNVSYDGRQLALTDKEYQILLLLISHPTKTFSTQNIFESVWNEPYTQFSNNTIMVHIKNLRNKLEAGCGCAHLIKTVWGKGYKFEE